MGHVHVIERVMARSRAVLAAGLLAGGLFFERLKGRRDREIFGKEVECPNIIWDSEAVTVALVFRATVASVTTRPGGKVATGNYQLMG